MKLAGKTHIIKVFTDIGAARASIDYLELRDTEAHAV